MEDYNFWQDLFDTYQSLPDWMKALWLIVPPAFVLALIALVMRYRVAVKEAENNAGSGLVYIMRQDEFDRLQVTRHGGQAAQKSTVPILEQPDSEPVEWRNPKRPALIPGTHPPARSME